MTDRPRLLVTRRLPDSVQQRLARDYDCTFNLPDLPLDRIVLEEAMRNFDCIVPTITDRLDAALLSRPGVRVRMFANFGAGVEHIDLVAADAKGIVVSNTPDALTESTADIALLLMLMAARRAGEGERELRAGGWTGWRPPHMMGTSFGGKTLGLLGFGRIAQAVAARSRAFGMSIAYHSRTRAVVEIEHSLSARYLSFDELVEQCDILSIHLPGGPDTRHLVDAGVLSRMKHGAILINTARGSVVDEGALAEALGSGDIAAAGLDGYEREPLIHQALMGMQNVVLLPHLGSATIETRTAMGMQAADNIDEFFAGRQPRNRVG